MSEVFEKDIENEDLSLLEDEGLRSEDTGDTSSFVYPDPLLVTNVTRLCSMLWRTRA